jgi:tetratricopeptide (TPR) repeat protein
VSSMSYGYNVRTERLRVLGLPELFAFLILIGVVCWMVFPRDLSSSLRSARLDAVTFSYMQAWLKAKPDDHELRLLMARELILQGDFVAADEQLQVVTADSNGRYDTQIAWLELRRDFTRLMAIDADNRRGTMLEHETLTRLRAIDWAALNSEKRIRFAEMALAMGSVDLAVQAYRRLADSAANPSQWYVKAAKVLLAHGRYSESADAYIAAMDARGNYTVRKRYFLAALSALQSGSLHDKALRLAQARERAFYNDKAVLYRLMTLAQAGGNMPLAEHYAVLLLGLPSEEGSR